jgi:hypothetical protein
MLGRCLAGVLLGLPLSMALVGLVVWCWPGSSQGVVIPALLAFFPVYTAVMVAAYLFGSARRAWGWLAVANLAAFALLWVAQRTLPGL